MSASASRAWTETTAAPPACCTTPRRHRQQARMAAACGPWPMANAPPPVERCADMPTPFTNLYRLARLASWPVAAVADCPSHGPAPGSPRADVLPPLGACPVALPSAVREVARCPARRPETAPLAGLAPWMRRSAVVVAAAGLGLAAAVALHPAAGSV